MPTSPHPFYQKLSYYLISITLICVGISYGREVILPVLFSILMAALLLPVTKFLGRKGLGRVLSIGLPLFVTIVLCGGIMYLISTQVINFLDDVPMLRERVNEVMLSFQKWVRTNTNMKIWQQNIYINQTLDNLKESAPQIASSTFGSITDILSYAILLPMYSFLILYYRTLIKRFLIDIFKNGSEQSVTAILIGSTTIAQRYITGLVIETGIVFGLNALGFIVLGIKYAIFLALLAALLNLIPYLGMLVANVICMFVTLISSPVTSDALWVGAILGVVQFIDNNFGMPLIVGNTVRINSLVTILGVIVGGALCGFPGMFLAIPALAISKVICDHVDGLKPWGDLMGDGTTPGKPQDLPTNPKDAAG